MKKIVFSLFAISVLLVACSKDNDPILDSNIDERAAVSTLAVPTSFTQKLLMELFTTAYCATCPDAMYKFQTYANQYPNRVFGASIHSADGMNSSMFNTMDSIFDVNVYSSGSFNRLPYNNTVVLPKTQWASSNMVTSCLAKTANCGLKISSQITGTTATITVTSGFATALSGNYRLTVYLVEDSVTGTGSNFNQSNYYNTTIGSPFYNLGNPIVGYKHNNVLRKVLTPNTGLNISNNGTIAARSWIMKNFTTSTIGYNSSKLYVIAFIHKYGTSATTHEIMNVQRAKIGTLKNWD